MPKRSKGLKDVPNIPKAPPPPRPRRLRYSQAKVPTDRISEALNRASESGLVPIHMCDATGNETWIVFEQSVV